MTTQSHWPRVETKQNGRKKNKELRPYARSPSVAVNGLCGSHCGAAVPDLLGPRRSLELRVGCATDVSDFSDT